MVVRRLPTVFFFFFFNDTATTEIYTLSLHDARPIFFLFKNFKFALAFTNAMGDISEAEGHHPGLLTEWGKVTVTWWSHSIKGLHRNDFIMAARTDEVAKDAEGRK